MKKTVITAQLCLGLCVSVCSFSDVTTPQSYGNTESTEGTKQSYRPNVLLIGIEVIRADHVSRLGYFRNTTPTLDKLAHEGVIFSRAIATSSWTLPTNMSVFTSLYPSVHKVTDNKRTLPKRITTLAQVLKKNGYLTAAFVTSPVLDGGNGFSRGFDLYDDFSAKLDLAVGLLGNEATNQDMFTGARTCEVLNRTATAWLQKNHKKPFFMFLFYFDSHYPYTPPPPFDTTFDPDYVGPIEPATLPGNQRKMPRPAPRDLEHLIALYDGGIQYTDEYISKLLDALRKYGILDNTLVIVFADHGEAFYEHDKVGHGEMLYNEVIHIPLILRWPHAIPPSRQIDALVSQVDIMPTVLDYLNVEHDGFMQGRSLKALIEGHKAEIHDAVFAELSARKEDSYCAVVSGGRKFILDLSTGRKELFDLTSDPEEQVNLYKEQSLSSPMLLESKLTRWRVRNDRLFNILSGSETLPQVELDEDKLRQLRGLGYIQ